MLLFCTFSLLFHMQTLDHAVNPFKLSKVTASILSVYSLHSTQIGLSLVSVTYGACLMM